MKQTNWDDLPALDAADRVARQVTSRGVHYEAGIKPQDYMETPVPVEGEFFYRHAAKDPNWVDFRGRKFDRLTVIGRAKEGGKKQKGMGASWLCRCACGGYCMRRTKSLRVAAMGGNSFAGSCGRCEVERKIMTGDLRPETLDRLAKSARQRFAEK